VRWTTKPPLRTNAQAVTPRLGSEFDAFLFAPVGDQTGMPISVVTMLARLDVDPWQEAARLAALAPEAAAQNVASMLKAIPDPALQGDDLLGIASRLVARLPRPTPATATPLQGLFVANGTPASRHRANVLFLAIYLIFMLGTQLVMANLWPTQAVPLPTSRSDSAPSQIARPPTDGSRDAADHAVRRDTINE
jgi:hypothetical protein